MSSSPTHAAADLHHHPNTYSHHQHQHQHHLQHRRPSLGSTKTHEQRVSFAAVSESPQHAQSSPSTFSTAQHQQHPPFSGETQYVSNSGNSSFATTRRAVPLSHLAASSAGTSSFPDVFDDSNVLPGNRRSSLALPRIDTAEPSLQPPAIVTSSATSSHSSSPYASPRLPPKARIGSMGGAEITLPPLSSAVPMRRGAVSGESSGPSLPFPPIRLPPQNEEDIPSRGPSPTLGKRPSFSLGHSNHVPPGPNAHLPMPALIGGSAERRGAPSQPPPPSSSSASSLYGYHQDGGGDGAGNAEQSRSGAMRMSNDGGGYYYSNSSTVAHPNAPRSFSNPSYAAYNNSKMMRGESGEDMGPTGGQGSYHYSSASISGNAAHRPPTHFGSGDEPPYYSHNPHMPPGGGYTGGNGMPFGAPRYGAGGRYDHDGGPYGAGGGPRQMSYGLSMSPDDHLMPITGKRPRSAPRVLSSQPRIFACSQCPARFARNHDLKRHQRGHLSVRPYPCTWCGKSFSRKDALKRHVLVKGCGKDKKGGGGGDAQRKSGSSGGEEGGSGGTDRSRSDAAGDRDEDDRHHGDDHSDGDEEDDHIDDAQQHHHYHQHGHSGPHQAGVSYAQAYHHQQPHHNGYDSSSSVGTVGGLYRWSKPATMPSLASQAASSMRVSDFAGAATSFAGFAATRRPSASMA